MELTGLYPVPPFASNAPDAVGERQVRGAIASHVGDRDLR